MVKTNGSVHFQHPKIEVPWKMMVGRLFSFWNGPFVGDMLIFGGGGIRFINVWSSKVYISPWPPFRPKFHHPGLKNFHFLAAFCSASVTGQWRAMDPQKGIMKLDHLPPQKKGINMKHMHNTNKRTITYDPTCSNHGNALSRLLSFNEGRLWPS